MVSALIKIFASHANHEQIRLMRQRQEQLLWRTERSDTFGEGSCVLREEGSLGSCTFDPLARGFDGLFEPVRRLFLRCYVDMVRESRALPVPCIDGLLELIRDICLERSS